MRDTIDMAREVKMPYDFVTGEPIYIEKLKAFEALVRADEREIVMNEPLTKAQWQRFEDEIRADEREACAKVCDDLAVDAYNNNDILYEQCAAAIRARGNT